MADVFVSYARSDKARVAPLVAAIEAQGWTVWWDPAIDAGQQFDDQIEAELKAAKAVLVVRTPSSAASRWVRGKAREAADRIGICVLPFANMSGDAEQEYFSDGITGDIITDLSKVSALAVVARNTAFTFKGKSVDVPQVARQLKVSHVLEGSVRKAGQRVRITAQLIDGAGGSHVWAERYDRDLNDIFALQDEISEAIVKALRLKLLPEEKKAIEQRGTENVEAYNLYLMARQSYVTGHEADARRSDAITRLCGRATEMDPNCAHAWALMAHGLIARAKTALAQDPNNGTAMAYGANALATIGDAARAKEWMGRALLIDPDNMNARCNFACALTTELEEKDAALKLLGPVLEKMGTGFLNHARTDPDLDPLRDDPRFQAMIASAEARLASA